MIFEIAPPTSFLGKSIAELELRTKYHIEVIAVKDVLTDQITMVPPASFRLKDGEILVVIAKDKDIQKIK
jgi:trk system potassium uptake protein TrkA